MGSGRNRLTATRCEKHKGRARLFDGGGLILNVTHSGTKHWIYRWTVNKRVREMGLGSYPAISLAKARERADECRRTVAEGRDPKAERDRESGKTFGEAADSYFKSMQSKWSNDKSRHQWKKTLVETCKPIRTKQVADIETIDVLNILQPIWEKVPETASRTRGRMENVLDFAKAKHWRIGENPARWKGHLQNILPPRQKTDRKHFAAMPYQEVPAFVERLRKSNGLSSRALELTILTVARTSEILNSTWPEFDLDAALWVIPAGRMKARSEHRVPLTSRAVEILTALHDTHRSDFLFAGNKADRPLSNMAMEMLLRRMKIQNATVHGFRSSFRDWCGDETSFPREIAEAALAHAVGSEVERSYRRGDALAKRRQLMEMWADYCLGVQTGKVVTLRS
ncbi:MAG: integrase arm-type DNA-binding domain-containing protein [Stappiaceae bacterium]